MSKCTKCGTPGAYVGLNSVECKNSRCENFKLTEEKICPCCGIAGHEALEGTAYKPKGQPDEKVSNCMST